MVKYTYQTLGGEKNVSNHENPFSSKFNILFKSLFDIRRVGGMIWNDCVQMARYYYRLGGKWITKTDLQKELKGISFA